MAVVDVAETLKDPRTVLVLAMTTAVVWMAGLAANALVLAAVGVEPTPELAARMLVAGYLAGLLPAPPGRVGVFETGVAAALVSAGVRLGAAVTAGVVLHVGLLVELGLLLAGTLVARKWRPGPA
jgi:uncharacterized membrane protein YbhN (UPF0104 family)